MDTLMRRSAVRVRYRRRRYCRVVWWSDAPPRPLVHRHYCVRRRWHRGIHRDLAGREFRTRCS